jgi:hypothetical protein
VSSSALRTVGLRECPDQSTLWRSWHNRFTAERRSTVETAARTIRIEAQNADVAVAREPERRLTPHSDEENEPDINDQAILDGAATVADHISRVVFPAFSLDRGEGCKIQERLLGLADISRTSRLAANEGARSFVYESTRDRAPLGHARREQIRDLSIDYVRAMYRQAITRLLNEVAEIEQFFRAGIVATGSTEADPFTGDRTGHEDEIMCTKEKTDEYTDQWATVQLVGSAVPIVLDARPVGKRGDSTGNRRGSA